ncbi:MAG: hypothetical protein ABI743_08845 [bacterium]
MSVNLPPEARLTQQERANYLEDFIQEVNREIDAILAGRDFEREIKALRFRISLLDQSRAYSARVTGLQAELRQVESDFAALKPQLDALDAERRFYRSQTSGY